MKGVRTAAFAFLLTCLSGASGECADKCEMPPVPPKEKAKTLAELAARYDSTSCKDCHEEIYNEWEKSLHARSILGTPRTAPTILTAVDKGIKNFACSGAADDKDLEVRHLMMCAKCHLPQLDEATDDVAREIIATIRSWQKEEDETKLAELQKKIESVNIGCMVCHNKKAIVHKWSDGYPQPDTVYGANVGTHDAPDFPKMAKAPALSESIFCGQCHGLGPNFELDQPSQCATLYGSYLFAYIPEGGSETCQECHMHKPKLGHDMEAYRSEPMRKMALDVDVESQALFWRKDKASGVIPEGIVHVNIRNKTGHAIPDG